LFKYCLHSLFFFEFTRNVKKISVKKNIQYYIVIKHERIILFDNSKLIIGPTFCICIGYSFVKEKTPKQVKCYRIIFFTIIKQWPFDSKFCKCREYSREYLRTHFRRVSCWCCDSPDLPTFTKPCCADLPELPILAKGHFWEKCDSPRQIRRSLLNLVRVAIPSQ
jgi:hypothetical protein